MISELGNHQIRKVKSIGNNWNLWEVQKIMRNEEKMKKRGNVSNTIENM